jgi:NAD-dependent deacetylase
VTPVSSKATRRPATFPPRCPDCGANLRPDVVWFGELLPAAELQASIEAASRCDVFLAVGTSGLEHPAAALPMLAHEAGARIVVINPDDDVPLLSASGVIHLKGSAAAVLPPLVAALESAGPGDL